MYTCVKCIYGADGFGNRLLKEIVMTNVTSEGYPNSHDLLDGLGEKHLT